jgi:PAS domain S-box-containing protein
MAQQTFAGDSQRPKTLRERAEQMARTSPTDIAGMASEDVQRLVQELQIHQMEVEIQNEDLRVAQVELAESRDRYSNLYDFAPVGYATLNKDGKILEANLTAAAMLGLQRKDLLRLNISNFVSRKSQDKLYLHRQAVFSSEIKHTSEMEMHTADGTPLWVRLESIACGAEPDRHWRTALVDITASRHVQQQLEDSEQRYRRLTDAVTDYVYRVRIEHGRAVETIHGANCAAVTGYTPDEFHSNPLLWIAMVPEEDRPIVEQQAVRILGHQNGSPIEHRIRRNLIQD